NKFNAAEKYVGNNDVRVLANGEKLRGRYVLTTSDAATPSHNPDTFQTSEGFPMLETGENPNDRDYGIKENRDRVISRSERYDGRAAENVPTVDKNGVVIDGNDRVMSGILAAQKGTDAEYIEVLKEK